MAKNTQKTILEKAENLLWKQGYEGTSLNDVARTAGVSKGAFFHYYPNKQAISQQVIDKYAKEQWLDSLNKHLDQATSVKNGLLEWLSETLGTLRAHEFKGGCLLGNLALELSDQNDAARQAIKGHFLDLENALVSHLRAPAKDGKLVMEPRQFARLFIATLQGITMMVKVHKDNNRAGREFMALAEMIEYMIRD